MTYLYRGDCAEVMSNWDSDSVDLIVTSPPYATQRISTYGGIKEQDYVQWFLPISEQLMRCLAPSGSFILNIKEHVNDGVRSHYVHDLVSALSAEGWRWVDTFIWVKTNPVPGKWPNRFKDGWEHLFHFSLTKDFTMNQEQVLVPSANPGRHDKSTRGREVSSTGAGFGVNKLTSTGRDMVLPSNVLQGPVGGGLRKTHSAVFPEYLPEFFIKLLSNEGDLVLDPFMGSGTTVEVAERLGRVGAGIEVDKAIYKETRRRLK